ncbi:MAG TPA: DJ-1/PfpI family protein [Methanomassiliicoccales archaeon]|nr:DJ-1/PfpI family protein [Methanomassiliicoccales archaeon]
MAEDPGIFYLLYDGYAGFELVFAANNLMRFKTTTVGFEKTPCRSLENLWTMVDLDVEELDPEKVDLLIIPGGHPSEIINDPKKKEKVGIFLEKVREIHRHGGKLAAICGGPEWLAAAGVLDGRRCTHSQDQPAKAFDKAIFTNEYLTVDGNIITAQGQAYAEFAVEMGRQMGIYKSEEEAKADLDWLRDRK